MKKVGLGVLIGLYFTQLTFFDSVQVSNNLQF